MLAGRTTRFLCHLAAPLAESPLVQVRALPREAALLKQYSPASWSQERSLTEPHLKTTHTASATQSVWCYKENQHERINANTRTKTTAQR